MAHGGTTTVALSLISLGLRRRAVAAELVADPFGILDLPDGFSYKIIDFAGDDMDDGYRVPLRPDAMACFRGPDNTLILMRNHDMGPSAGGGVTRVVLDAATHDRLSSNFVLVGTAYNRAGGPSPWGFLTCEASTSDGGVRHGYVYSCPTHARTVQSPRRIDGYGRFNHGAVCVDPGTKRAYLTEDRVDGCLYRFVPHRLDNPFVGKLQALEIVGEHAYDASVMDEGDVLPIEWVDIDDPNPDGDTVREEAQRKGAATLMRGEGIWFFDGQIYISSTTGGANGSGQIFRLIDGEHPTLECLVCSTSTSVLDHPDDITVAPWSEVFITEGGDGDNYIRRVNLVGEVTDFACTAHTGSDLCGVCFSPDGKAMFVNLRRDGLTLAITGPFPQCG